MGGLKKQYLEINGRPVLAHAIEPFLHHPALRSMVVALPPEDAGNPPEWLTGMDSRIAVVAGGASRGESVSIALHALPQVDVVMVHDGARPLVSQDTVEACFQAACRGVGGIAGVPATDTLKEVDSGQRIVGTLDRTGIWHAHTPQAFPAGVIREAYRIASTRGFGATDDATLVEAAGGEVVMIQGNPENLKVTRPQDIPLAEALLSGVRGR